MASEHDGLPIIQGLGGEVLRRSVSLQAIDDFLATSKRHFARFARRVRPRTKTLDHCMRQKAHH